MRLTNLLKLPGGIYEQGRPVRFDLRYLDGKIPSTRQVDAVMLPVSEVDIYRVKRAAQEAAAAKDAPLPEPLEYIVRFLQASLRDPGDLGARLIEDETDLQALRTGLAGPQYSRLTAEYQQLIETEYPEQVDGKNEEELRREAEGFSDGAPDSPPSS